MEQRGDSRQSGDSDAHEKLASANSADNCREIRCCHHDDSVDVTRCDRSPRNKQEKVARRKGHWYAQLFEQDQATDDRDKRVAGEAE